jgi:hypothetical protein
VQPRNSNQGNPVIEKSEVSNPGAVCGTGGPVTELSFGNQKIKIVEAYSESGVKTPLLEGWSRVI